MLSEANRFKQAVVMLENSSDLWKTQATFVADNVDHNIATLDCHGAFHGMGIIAVKINKQPDEMKQQVLKRPKKLVGRS